MKTSKYVILGGGMVAGYAAKELVERGLRPGELTILSADSSLPYERPPLSKGFLLGKDSEENIRINSENFYREHEIEVRLGCAVAKLDSSTRVLHLSSGEDLGFEKLLLATGARVRKLDIPGSQQSGLYYLRSLEDSIKIRTHAAGAKAAVVLGGGFIGMEVASVLAQKGIATTMVLPEDRIWKGLFTPEMSRFFEHYYSARGVSFRKGATVVELQGDGSGKTVILASREKIPCDFCVAGIGVHPVMEFLDGSGIAVSNGIVVNEYLETNIENIYAAGDAANYQDVLYGKRRRVEHWDNAVSQGQHCARAFAGERKPFVHVPYFFSDVFDLSYEFWGDASSADEIVERGSLSSNSFSVWWLREERLVGAFAMNRPEEEREAVPRWIASKQRIGGEILRTAASIAGA
jgi:NADPH-dependent 2,4-dienoyl-CoA reductase/sulfur reductase-like enzyme